jgi:nanoRNase/pAp phosphatase (c-di-AMP/oligoRNAs hydrolase)
MNTSIYHKAAAYINGLDNFTVAFVCGMQDSEVYVSTDIGDMRIHEEEVKAYASLYDANYAAEL